MFESRGNVMNGERSHEPKKVAQIDKQKNYKHFGWVDIELARLCDYNKELECLKKTAH